MSKDIVLEVFVSVVESGITVPITIAVGGTIVQGDMVNADDYFKELARFIRSDDPNFQASLQDTFAKFPHAMDLGAMMHLDEGADPEEIRKTREHMTSSYIHLKNSARWTEDGWIEMTGTLWRGKLEAVDGFWLGRGATS